MMQNTQYPEKGLATTLWRGLILLAVMSGTSWLGSTYPLIILAFWACQYYTEWTDAQQIAKAYHDGHVFMPTSPYQTPYGIAISNGPLDQLHVFDLTYLWIAAVILLLWGRFLMWGSWRWGVGLVVFWIPLIAMPEWDWYIGKIKYYPGGSRAYYEDHYQQVCDRAADGSILRDSRGVNVCRIVMKSRPPF